MVAAGLPEPRSDHAQAAIEMAMAMQRDAEHFSSSNDSAGRRINL
jgi:hypothetical protein